MIEIERQKLLQAIVFFVHNTKNCGLVKLFKLLYYLDMLHFRETGRSVTGLPYRALPYGPVPTALYTEMSAPPADLRGLLRIQSPPKDGVDEHAPKSTRIEAIADPGFDDLTKREQRIMREVAEVFRDVSAEHISDISHARNGPWDLAVRAAKGKWGTPIEFLDSVNLKIGTGQALSREELEDRAADYAEAKAAFG